MSSQNELYCHIIGRKIVVNGENKKVSFEPRRSNKVCGENTKVCDGNCKGCNLL